jgi:hypothetical protein
MKTYRLAAISAVVTVSLTGAMSAAASASSAVIAVNNTLLDAIRASASTTPPPRAARAIGMVGIAMYDAVNASSGLAYNPYSYGGGAVSGLSRDAVALSSGYTMMASLFPTLSVSLNADLDTKLNGLSMTASQRAASLAFGQSVADNLFVARAGDGSATAQFAYVPGTDPGDFQPTQPSNPVLPGWGNVTTFGVTSNSQFDVGSPPVLGSTEWIADYDEVKALGCATCGTAEQQTIARYWADGGGTFTPPGHWLQIATDMMGDLSTMQAARLTALVGASIADGGITAWNTKYTYDVWRPITAIRNCTVGVCGVDGDPIWTPLLSTPNFPSYTSGHSTFSGSAAGALARFMGTDDVAFCTGADPLSGVAGDRCFTSFSDAAYEAGISRIYGGIHYEFDNGRAVEAGLKIGSYVASNNFQLNGVPEPDSWALMIAGFGLTGASLRRRRNRLMVAY